MASALGIDVGTTNVKVALVDGDGHEIASAGRPLRTVRDGGVAEQDADQVWAAITDATGQVTAAHPKAAAEVGAIGVCSQYSSIVPVDEAGAALAPFVLHMDRRGTDRSWAILDEHADAFTLWVERHGIPPVGSGLSLGHLLWFQHERPELHERVDAYLEPMDFVNLRLTGRVAATQCTQFTTQLCDNRVLGVTTYDDDLVARSGVDGERLPSLVEPESIIGTVLPGVAADLGLAPGAVVVAGMNDSHAGAFATGALVPGRVGLMIGTTAVVLDAVDRHGVDLDHEIVSMPSPGNRWLAWAENGIAGRAVQHVVEEILELPGGFSDLEALVAAGSPGSNGVLFLPWLTGSLAPRAVPAVRGGFVNLSLDTTRADVARSLLEGTALNLAWLWPAVESFTGTPADEIVFGGGAARSRAWSQILADVLGRPVRGLRSPATVAARAVANAALRSAAIGGPPADADPDVVATFEPDRRQRGLYDLLGEQFRAAFGALRPINEAVGARLGT